MFKPQPKNLNIDTEKMPLGDISEQTIEKGFTALLEVEAEVNGAGRRGQLEYLSGQFYTYIPTVRPGA